MRPDHLEKLNLWFLQQLEAVKFRGESEQDAGEAVADLALRRVFLEHFEELRGDREFIEETFAVVSSKTSPTDLRNVATQARQQGDLKIGEYLGLIADHREAEAFQDRWRSN